MIREPMHILEKSSCCIDEKLKLKFMKTVIHLGWPLKVKNSFVRKTRYKSVLRTAIVFLTHNLMVFQQHLSKSTENVKDKHFSKNQIIPSLTWSVISSYQKFY